MGYLVSIENSEAPHLHPYIQIPNEKAQEIRKNNRSAISFARSIVAQYEPIDVEKGSYWRIINGLKMYSNLKEPNETIRELLGDFFLHGEYEPYTTKLIKSIVKEGEIVIDVGASMGYFTLLLAQQVGKNGKVYSVEATCNQIPYLKMNTEANGFLNVDIKNIAAWSQEKEIDINGNRDGCHKVKGIPLDSVILEPIDFIKMDIDGSEPEALKGMLQIIERSSNLKMVIEYYPEYMKKLGNNPQEMIDILDKYFTYEKIDRR